MLSTVIWLPIFAGIAVLLTGSDRNARMARVLALIGAIAGFAVALPLWTGFDRARRLVPVYTAACVPSGYRPVTARSARPSPVTSARATRVWPW